MEEVYKDRNLLVQLCVQLARAQGLQAGVRRPVEDADWPVLTIVLPEVGEVAWHIPQKECLLTHEWVDVPYDGHTNEDKAARIRKFVEGRIPGAAEENQKTE